MIERMSSVWKIREKNYLYAQFLSVKEVRHIEMPKAAPKKSISHFQKTRDDIEMK